MNNSKIELTNTAYFYADTFWGPGDSEWIKTLLLFFDNISILLPKYMYGRHHEADPHLSVPLEEQGLLRILEPGEFITQEMAEDLATVVVQLVTTGAFDDLSRDQAIHFAELSRTRVGWGIDMELSDWLVAELKEKGLARDSRDGVSVPLHPVVRKLILFLLSQIVRKYGGEGQTTFHPVTYSQQTVHDTIDVLSMEKLPSAGHVVALDVEHVALSLETVPLEDVLLFREEHGEEYRAYGRDLRRFVRELGQIEDPKLRRETLVDRESELADRAVDLRKALARRWVKPGGKMGVGAAGAAWNFATGDVLGGLLSLGQAALEMPDTAHVEAYTYLVQLERGLSRGL